MILEHLLTLLAALVVLGFAAHYMVSAAIRIALHLRVSEAFIGLTIVAAGTSAPEIAVSVLAALDGQGALSVGNVIGSNIFNLGFILGLVALVRPQQIEKKMVYRDGVVLLGSTVMVLFMLWNQAIGRLEGMLLLAALVAYTSYLWVKKDIPSHEEEAVDQAQKTKDGRLKDFFIFLASLAILVKSADFVVEAAVGIATLYGISEWAIGATIVAAGTSLPEVATSLIATLRGKFGLSIGNVVGSDIFNALGIIGVSAVIAPLTLSSGGMMLGLPDNIVSMLLLVATILLVLFFMRTRWALSRTEGAVLLIISVARMGFEVYLGQ